MLEQIKKEIKTVDTDDLRGYLTSYQEKNNCSKVTIDNVRRIHKIKTTKVVRETYSDETIEKLRDSCEEIRDLVLIDFLIYRSESR